MSRLLGAIDCGTNSTRLLVAEAGGPGAAGGTTTIERHMRITRLGRGVDATGELAPEAVDRTLSVLREYRATLDRHGVERVRMTATSAARDATNRDTFFVAVREALDVVPELLTGEEDFGIVPLEAQACGTPVVALGRGGAVETVRSGETGLLVEAPAADAFAVLCVACQSDTTKPAKFQSFFSTSVRRCLFSQA